MNLLNCLSGLIILSALHDLCLDLDDLNELCSLDLFFTVLFDCLSGTSITAISPALKSLLSVLYGLKDT